MKVHEISRKKTERRCRRKILGIKEPARMVPRCLTLIRKLVATSAHPEKADGLKPRNGADDGNVIMDMEIDGIRCLLVRTENSSPGTVKLSPREGEIVRMIAKGYPNKAIAGVLEISGWTVCTHLRRIFSKLGVTSRAAMIARVMDLKLL